MILEHYKSPTGFCVSVSVTAAPLVEPTRLERFVAFIGSEKRVIRLCDGFNFACCAICLVWLVVWFVWLRGIVMRTFHPSAGEAFFLSVGWLPLMLIQIFTGALRYALFSLQIKTARQVAEATSHDFFRAIDATVTVACGRFAAQHQPDEKPTLQ